MLDDLSELIRSCQSLQALSSYSLYWQKRILLLESAISSGWGIHILRRISLSGYLCQRPRTGLSLRRNEFFGMNMNSNPLK
jgi:hypothetical protein